MIAASRRVCITGISGFTGRHLAKVLIADGWHVSGIGPDPIEGVPSHLDADIRNRDELEPWLAATRPTHIIHLAALAHVVGDPLGFYATNLLGTEAFIEAVANTLPGINRLILASSANIYGNAAVSPISEETAVRPVNHYALSKAATELLAAKWFARMPITITRPFNYTGPGQSEQFVFAKVAGAFRRRDPSITLGNINASRDLADVGFVCEAYRRLLDYAPTGATFNICTGTAISLKNALDILSDLTGHSPKIEIDTALLRPDDIDTLVGSPERLFAAVGPIAPMARNDLFAAMLASA